ncbi:hypothetical protein K461DRAFT_37124 [Myriangium duriaei CBS 260.36]|uniref:C2H2-type domain-containing protein n=1 Tax=Myriangium duriaei CBS 260.36 TaxID=1168546 RepID=A0A9P4MHF2_9PEZI|nr:hypothetical protein K461DRAFT_37124 [Myriangium duriaei CBS 260.36]
MTMLKETSRPINQHRPSFGSGQSILPRNSLPRTHGYSTSLGSLNPAHRVTRRKSSNLSPAAINAAVQAIESHDDGKNGNRRSFQSRIALGSLNPTGLQSPPNSLPGTGMLAGRNDSAIIDGPPLSSISEKPNSKSRIRRASDGSTLGSGKKKPGHGELKCETCGKGYKHSSCLTKHLWEHTPEWSITSKLLISKHQQVQLLEAASVLVAMNQEGPEANRSSDSEQSYTSPAASGFSDREGSVSSIETTPPPHGEYPYGHQKRVSNASSGFSRSYQSVFSNGPHQHRRQWSTSSNRPGTAQTALTESYPGEDQADLAAAVGLLSCSYGTPQTGPTNMPADVPPVPPLPEKYQSLPRNSYHAEVDMDDASSSEDDRSQRYGNRQEEHDRIFGEMDD